jgi:hypothetical protein
MGVGGGGGGRTRRAGTGFGGCFPPILPPLRHARDVGAGPPGLGPSCRKGWIPSGNYLKSRQVMGGAEVLEATRSRSLAPEARPEGWNPSPGELAQRFHRCDLRRPHGVSPRGGDSRPGPCIVPAWNGARMARSGSIGNGRRTAPSHRRRLSWVPALRQASSILALPLHAAIPGPGGRRHERRRDAH